MKVIAGTNSIIEATLMGDSMTTNRVKVFLASSSVAMVKRTAALPDIAYYTVTQVTGGVTYSYEYTPDIDYSLRLSLRKWYDRAYQNGDTYTDITIKAYDGGGSEVDTLTARCYLYEGISYNDIAAPALKDGQGTAVLLAHNVVTPPDMMLNLVNGFGIQAEASPNYIWQEVLSGGTISPISPTGARTNQIPITKGSTLLQQGTTGVGYHDSYKMYGDDDCASIICLRWTSQTGAVRQHQFYFDSQQRITDESVDLLSAGDGFRRMKNVSNAMRIWLPGLTSYGMWYYQDLFQASDIHAVIIRYQSAADFEAEMSSEQSFVTIDGDATMPLGNGYHTFSATLKYRHYDTF